MNDEIIACGGKPSWDSQLADLHSSSQAQIFGVYNEPLGEKDSPYWKSPIRSRLTSLHFREEKLCLSVGINF